MAHPSDRIIALDVEPVRLEPAANPVPPAPEPEPDEEHRLPHAPLPPTPVLALLRARWPWLVTAALLGTVAALLTGGASTYTGTAVLRLNDTGQDSVRTKQRAQTVERSVRSLEVLAAAAEKRGTAAERLTPRVSAVWQQDTDLVDVSVTSTDETSAVRDANAVADAVVQQAGLVSARRLQTIRLQADRLLKNGAVADRSAETARRSALGAAVATQQNGASADATDVYVADAAVDASRAGLTPLVKGGFGALGGLLVGIAAALLAGLGRRRVGSAQELRSLSPDLTVLETSQAGEVAGRLLEGGRSTLVVLSLSGSSSPAVRFASTVVGHVRTHGSSVTLVNAVAPPSDPALQSPSTLPDEAWVLRRDIRRDVQSYFNTDTLVVACSADPEAVGLISGQSDLHAVIVAKRRRTSLQEIRDAAAAVGAADPVVVLAS
jgi:hypothetical protein